MSDDARPIIDSESEAALVAAALVTPAAFVSAWRSADLSAAMLVDPTLGRVCAAAVEVIASGGVVDALTLARVADVPAAQVIGAANTGSVLGVDSHAAAVRYAYRKRQLAIGLQAAIDAPRAADAAKTADETLRAWDDSARSSESLFDAGVLLADDSPIPPAVIGPHVAGVGDLWLWAGPPKSRKSMLCLDMLAAFACGDPWFGLQVERPLTSLLVNAELSRNALRRRLASTGKTADDLAGRLVLTDRGDDGLTVARGYALRRAMRANGSDLPDVVVVDPIANFVDGDENKNDAMQDFLRVVRAFRDAINPAAVLLLVHHTRKASQEDLAADPFNAIRGASSLRGAYDAGTVLWRLGDEGEAATKTRMVHELRNGPPVDSVTLQYGDDGRVREASSAEAPTVDSETLQERILRTLRDDTTRGRAHTIRSLTARLASEGVRERAAKSAIESAMYAGALLVQARGPIGEGLRAYKGHLWCIGCPGEATHRRDEVGAVVSL